MSRLPFLTKLTLRNFRSIRDETVEFANPLILVGRNGSGKSNFVEAITLLAECMQSPLQSVLHRHPGMNRVGQMEAGVEQGRFDFAMRMDFSITSPATGVQRHHGHYAFSLDSPLVAGVVEREQCCITTADRRWSVWFDRKNNQFQSNLSGLQPVMDAQSLVLPIIGGLEPFADFVKGLSSARTYALEPNRMRSVQNLERGATLKPDGSNVATVLVDAMHRDPEMLSRVSELLSPVAPSTITVSPQTIGQGPGQKVILFFLQAVSDTHQLLLNAENMSDGTMTALGLIVAVLQEPPASVIAIEEPEATIHPGALDAIADLLDMAAQRSQVVITTHSPELLDTKWIQPENLRVVEWEKGTTHISKLGEAPIKALQQHLMGAGELLRANALDAAPLLPTDMADIFDENLA